MAYYANAQPVSWRTSLATMRLQGSNAVLQRGSTASSHFGLMATCPNSRDMQTIEKARPCRMKFAPTAALRFGLTVMLLVAAGCSSTVGSANQAKYDKMSCSAL